MAPGLTVRTNMARKTRPDSEVAAFINALYAAGGYTSWAEFARDANVIPASLSHWKDGNTQVSGPNLVKLIHAAIRRSGTSLEQAARETDPLVAMYQRTLQEQMPTIERAAQAIVRDAGARALEVREETLKILRAEVQAMVDDQTKELTKALRTLAKEVRAQSPEQAREGRREGSG